MASSALPLYLKAVVGVATLSTTVSAVAIRGAIKPVTFSEAAGAHRKLTTTIYSDEDSYNAAGGDAIDLCEDFEGSTGFINGYKRCSNDPVSSTNTPDTPDGCFTTALKPGFSFGSSSGGGVLAVSADAEVLPSNASNAIGALNFADASIITFAGDGIPGLSFRFYTSGATSATITAYDVANNILSSEDVAVVSQVPSFVGILSPDTATLIKKVQIFTEGSGVINDEIIDDLCFGSATATIYIDDQEGYNAAGGDAINLCETFEASLVGQGGTLICSSNPVSSTNTPDACFTTALKPGFSFGSSSDNGVVVLGADSDSYGNPSKVIAARSPNDANIITFDGDGITGLSFQLYRPTSGPNANPNVEITAYDVAGNIIASDVVLGMGNPSSVGIISTTTLIKRVQIFKAELIDDLCFGSTPAKFYINDQEGYNDAGGDAIDLCEDFETTAILESWGGKVCPNDPVSSANTPDACFTTALKPGFSFASSSDRGVAILGANFDSYGNPSTAIAASYTSDSNIITFDGDGITGLSFQLTSISSTTITAYDVAGNILDSGVVSGNGDPSFVGIISTTLIKRVQIFKAELIDDLCFGSAPAKFYINDQTGYSAAGGDAIDFCETFETNATLESWGGKVCSNDPVSADTSDACFTTALKPGFSFGSRLDQGVVVIGANFSSYSNPSTTIATNNPNDANNITFDGDGILGLSFQLYRPTSGPEVEITAYDVAGNFLDSVVVLGMGNPTSVGIISTTLIKRVQIFKAELIDDLCFGAPNTAPIAVCQDITLSAPGSTITAAQVDGGSTDNESLSADLTLTLDNNGPFEVAGPTQVMLTVTDPGGLFSTCTADITLNMPPAAVCQDITLPAVANCASGTITADQVDGGSTDSESDDLTLTLDNDGPFPVGEPTEVTLTVTDPEGLSDTCTASITVTDDETPSVDCGARGIMETCEEPVTVNFGAGKTNGCGVTTSASHVTCVACNGGGKETTRGCSVSTIGDSATITAAGGVGSHIVFTVTSENDNADNSGKFLKATATCTICTRNPSADGKPGCSDESRGGRALGRGNDKGGNDKGGNDKGGKDEGGNDKGGNDEGGDGKFECSAGFPDATFSCG